MELALAALMIGHGIRLSESMLALAWRLSDAVGRTNAFLRRFAGALPRRMG
jgi:hypothetical protein